MENEIKKLLTLVAELNHKIDNRDICPDIRRHWIPKHEVMVFLGYADTQMKHIEKQYGIVSTMIGKKKFYQASSLLKILNDHQSN